MEILVLKTNATPEDFYSINNLIREIPEIQKWTIDLEDCDKVLRIENNNKGGLDFIVEKIRSLGLLCEDLPE